jgi:hypothetical protein
MAAAPRKYAALDTSFLLALAIGEGDCEQVIDWLHGHNSYPLVTPTVLQELWEIFRSDKAKENRDAAGQALASFSTWGVLTAPQDPLENGIAELTAEALLSGSHCPHANKNDALVVAEAAHQGCAILITYRTPILDAPSEPLHLALLQRDAAGLIIVSPSDIVEFMKGQQ